MLSAFLVPFDRAFMFQITEQHSKLSSALQGHGSYLASNGWTVKKCNVPEIDLKGKTIYLRGDNGDKDLRVHRIWDLSNNWNRDKYMNQINDALQEFVNFASTSAAKTRTYLDRWASVGSICKPVQTMPSWMEAKNFMTGWSAREYAIICGTPMRGTVKATPKTNKVSSKPFYFTA